MSFPRYPKYRDSGVEWLGKVPEHWQILRLKHAANVFPSNVDKKTHEGETPVLLCNYTDVYYNDTITTGIPFMPATASEEQIVKFSLRRGDTLVTKDSETADDIAIAAYVPEDLPAVVCGYHLSIIRPRAGCSGAFIKRLFDSTYLKSRAAVLANGLTRVGLGQYELDNIDLPFPPKDEQRHIARFLLCETERIDALIAEQHRLIELLNEKRQAVISHAVTKGLNSDAPMKPSGVEWLGDVPSHWDVMALKNLVATPITDGPHETPQFLDAGIPFVSAEAVASGRIDFSRIRAFISTEDNSRYSAKYSPKLHDIYMVKSGATTGITAIVEDRTDFNIWSPLAAIRCGPRAFPYFVLNFMRSRNFLEAVTLGWSFGTQQNIGMGVIENLACTVPPLAEQYSISRFLTDETETYTALATDSARAIALLEERRTALISAAVTGKIDVRGSVAVQAA